jgi:hypothetical protein
MEAGQMMRRRTAGKYLFATVIMAELLLRPGKCGIRLRCMITREMNFAISNPTYSLS